MSATAKSASKAAEEAEGWAPGRHVQSLIVTVFGRELGRLHADQTNGQIENSFLK